jgi:hypothetical protein
MERMSFSTRKIVWPREREREPLEEWGYLEEWRYL